MTLQTDPSWLPNRRGKLTASRMKDAVAYLKSGKESEDRRKYKIELVAERMSDYAVDHIVTKPMQRGLDFEAPARSEYEEHTGNVVSAAALVDHPTIELFAATPDGFIRHDGLLEIKVPSVHKFIEWRIAGVVPDEHIPQMLAQLSCTDRTWTDFVGFCPEMPEGSRLFIRRFAPAFEEIERIEVEALKFLAEVDALFDLVTQAAA
ncbi:MAG: YqaJ viral recombinase family protein [Rhodospirillales bacterium]|nr:YqaJ viral recombinase family protein [Rhodospirillales bacterium]